MFSFDQGFTPIYILHMPNVNDLSRISENLDSRIISMNLAGDGNLITDAGRYSYALRCPEIQPPTAGRIFRKYNL